MYVFSKMCLYLSILTYLALDLKTNTPSLLLGFKLMLYKNIYLEL